MKPREIKKDIYCVGAIDWDRRLFDSLIPLPDGTSYNAYLIKGSQKTALIDTVDPPMKDVLLNNLDQLGIKRIDYVIFNHAEPDHSGSIREVLAKYPEAKAICTPRCKDMLIDRFMVAADRFKTVKDKETISLGNRTLEFIHAPWVHWPETMLTYLQEDEILFPCDFFVERELRIGNVMETSWEQAASSDVYRGFGRQKTLWNTACDNCRWGAYCSGDCLKHRLPGTGDPRTLGWLCAGWKQFYSHTEESFKALAQQIREERAKEQHSPRSPAPPPRAYDGVGRNDPCPCGSGKKFKKCCMARIGE